MVDTLVLISFVAGMKIPPRIKIVSNIITTSTPASRIMYSSAVCDLLEFKPTPGF